MIKGIIFDLDGVLAFSDKYHYKAWKYIADKEGIYFDEIINNRLRGVSRMESLEIILERANKEYSEEEKINLATIKNNLYVEYLDELKPSDIYLDTRKTLDILKEKGYKLAIGSSSRNTLKILTKTDLLHYFDVIVDGNKIKNSKPHPEVFIKAQEELNLLKEECVVIEDAFSGIDAANSAGITSIGIGDAKGYSKCSHTIDKISDILEII